jgi:hypothetical protein
MVTSSFEAIMPASENAALCNPIYVEATSNSQKKKTGPKKYNLFK